MVELSAGQFFRAARRELYHLESKIVSVAHKLSENVHEKYGGGHDSET
jgi:hypothetical protein